MELNDVELVTMAKAAHDEKAFATLVRRHQSPLRAFLRRLCGDAALADDIAQETFMKAHSSLVSFKGGGSFRSWLYSIAYREFLQDRRKAKAAARLEDALTQEAKGAETNQNLEEGLSLDLRRALAVLEDIERASILLCDAAGLSHSEAALALDTPLGSIKTYVARARQKMRDVLSGEFKPGEEAKSAPAINGVSYAF